ncbi:hypothetical protein HGA88_05920 [Candidatus Roizmanbacteria bacterium]|nr:hypothetical protein [Candidatus Roizmanbacteria bacterium]
MNAERRSIFPNSQLESAGTIRFEQPTVETEQGLHEECGIVAVVDPHNHLAAHMAYFAISNLDNRGQDGGGVGTPSTVIKREGRIYELFSPEEVSQLEPTPLAIAHTRYGTAGGQSKDNLHPHEAQYGDHILKLAHNGTVAIPQEVLDTVPAEILTSSDSKILTHYLTLKRGSYSSWQETFQNELPHFKGALNFVAITEEKDIIAVRGIDGIRPLSIGKLKDGGWCIASEPIAYSAYPLYGEFARDVSNGEIMTLTSDGSIWSTTYGEPQDPTHCLFEDRYFAKPSSQIVQNEPYLTDTRFEGGQLAYERFKKKGFEVDHVVPILNSGRDFADGVSSASGLRVRHTIDIATFHGNGRSFIMPEQLERVSKVQKKFVTIPIPPEMSRVIVPDDSAIRFTTSPEIVKMLKEAGATDVHLLLGLPPVTDVCNDGTNISSKTELPAARIMERLKVEHPEADEDTLISLLEVELATEIGATSVTFTRLEDLYAVHKREPLHSCTHCFDSISPRKKAEIQREQMPLKKEYKRGKNPPRLVLMASGTGTNVENVLMHHGDGTLSAEIAGIVVNNKDCGAAHIAEKFDIPVITLPSKGRLGKEKSIINEKGEFLSPREQYFLELAQEIKKLDADFVGMLGWNLVVDDAFIQSIEAPLFNLHPAYLPQDNGDKVMTSRGMIPVYRGPHAIQDVLENNEKITGATVHLVPSSAVDRGKPVLEQQVRIYSDDTLETLTQRVHEAEYMIVPAAINRMAHYIRKGYDIASGKIPF